MRKFVILFVVVLAACAGAAYCKHASQLSRSPRESVQLTAEKRQALLRLKDERKFEPHSYPPLGYTGIATPEDGAVARGAVNDVIGSILSRRDGRLTGNAVSQLIGRGMKRVDGLETEDRDRTADYMIEIWYLLGFRGSTGRFAHGAAFQPPDGYGEPLPPGWKSPTQPRPVGEP